MKKRLAIAEIRMPTAKELKKARERNQLMHQVYLKECRRREDRKQLYLKQCREAYRDWIERYALFEQYHQNNNERDHSINFHAIKKNLEMREMDDGEEQWRW